MNLKFHESLALAGFTGGIIMLLASVLAFEGVIAIGSAKDHLYLLFAIVIAAGVVFPATIVSIQDGFWDGKVPCMAFLSWTAALLLYALVALARLAGIDAEFHIFFLTMALPILSAPGVGMFIARTRRTVPKQS